MRNPSFWLELINTMTMDRFGDAGEKREKIFAL